MALMNVGGNFQLNTPAGLAYLRARSAGLPPGITTATRSYDLQMTWYKNQGKPGYPKWAAHPDKSKHVYRPNDIKDQGGRALDLPAGGPREWMSKHGPAFGWYRRIKVEPWHFEYEEWNDPSRFQSPAPTTPLPPTLEEDDMPARLIRHPNGSIAVVDGPTMTVLATVDEANALRMTGQVRDFSAESPWQNLPDGLAWTLMARIAARHAAALTTDPAAVAAALAPLLVPAVVDALANDAGLTEAQVQAAAERAIRTVLGGLD